MADAQEQGGAAGELEKLAGVPVEIEIAGRKLLLQPPKPFSKEFPQILKLAAPLADVLAGDGTVDVPSLLQQHAERVRPILALLAGVEEKWLEQLDWEDAIKLGTAVIAVNLDFFVRRILPALASAGSSLGGRLKTKPIQSPPGEPAAASAGQTRPSA